VIASKVKVAVSFSENLHDRLEPIVQIREVIFVLLIPLGVVLFFLFYKLLKFVGKVSILFLALIQFLLYVLPQFLSLIFNFFLFNLLLF